MSRLTNIIILAAAAMLVSLQIAAQRRITPTVPPTGVNENKNAQKPLDMSRVKEVTDADGVIILVDTVSGQEVVDSTRLIKAKGNIYPLLESVTVGVNLWDGVNRLLGQDYGIGSIRGEVSLHNRYKPFFEVGFSTASFTPDGNNYTFRSPVSPYFKIGAGYNIFYNSNPDYQLCFNLGYGLTNFSYSYNDVTVDEGYWGDPAHFALPSQRATIGYLEIGASIKVRLGGNISAGWNIYYHKLLHQSNGAYGPPVIIPGYGKRDGSIGINLMLMYTIPLSPRPVQEPDKQK